MACMICRSPVCATKLQMWIPNARLPFSRSSIQALFVGHSLVQNQQASISASLKMSNWRARRGSFVNRGRAGRATRGPPRPQTPELAVGDLIQSITTQKLRSTETAGPARITDCSLLTSFNWLSKSTEPTILIPGHCYVSPFLRRY